MAKVWEYLTNDNYQEFKYTDQPRTDIHQLFGFPPNKILDVGCAAGGVGVGILNKYPTATVWGVELNPQTAAIAKKRIHRVYEKSLDQWTPNELEEISSLDTILFLDVLEHIYNPWNQLKIISQYASSDAQIIISLPNIGHLSIIKSLIDQNWQYEQFGLLDITHIRFFTLNQMLKMFDETGFQTEAIKPLWPSYKLKDNNTHPNIIKITEETSIKIKNMTHWHQLNARQFGFRIRKK